MAKRKRLCTIRYDDKSYEAIEIDDLGFMFWTAVERMPDGTEVTACFPTGVEMVEDVFTRAGRVFEVSKLPTNAVLNPYACNM